MPSNVTLTTAITIQATNISAGTTPFNLALQGILLPITVWSSSDFFQVQNTATPIPLPAGAPIIYYAFVINLGTNPVTLTVAFNPFSIANIRLNPVTAGFGTFFMYAATAETNPAGIIALSAITSSGPTPIQYFLAA